MFSQPDTSRIYSVSEGDHSKSCCFNIRLQDCHYFKFMGSYTMYSLTFQCLRNTALMHGAYTTDRMYSTSRTYSAVLRVSTSAMNSEDELTVRLDSWVGAVTDPSAHLQAAVGALIDEDNTVVVSELHQPVFLKTRPFQSQMPHSEDSEDEDQDERMVFPSFTVVITRIKRTSLYLAILPAEPLAIMRIVDLHGKMFMVPTQAGPQALSPDTLPPFVPSPPPVRDVEGERQAADAARAERIARKRRRPAVDVDHLEPPTDEEVDLAFQQAEAEAKAKAPSPSFSPTSPSYSPTSPVHSPSAE